MLVIGILPIIPTSGVVSNTQSSIHAHWLVCVW